jgi:hypothetical protein
LLHLSSPIQLAIGLWVAERPLVDVLDTGALQSLAQRGLRKTRAPRERQLAYVNQHLDASADKLVYKRGCFPSLISDGEDFVSHRHIFVVGGGCHAHPLALHGISDGHGPPVIRGALVLRANQPGLA